MKHNDVLSSLFIYPKNETINIKPVDETNFTPPITEFFGEFEEVNFTIFVKNNYTAKIAYSSIEFEAKFTKEDPTSYQSIAELPDGAIVQFIIPSQKSFELKIVPKERDHFVLYGFSQQEDYQFSIYEILIPLVLTIIVMFFLKKYHFI